MSTVEDQNTEQNLQNRKDSHKAAEEHMAELERIRKQSESYISPALQRFKERRHAYAMQNKRVLLPTQQK